MFDTIVIGGGPAGVTAALRARELGATVTMLERSALGGTCLNDGVVPTRVLARAARLIGDAGQFSEYGLVGGVPSVDFPSLLAHVRRVVAQIDDKKHLLDHLQASGVRVVAPAGSVGFVDPHTVQLGSGERIEADRFIICAGGQSRRISFPGVEHALSYRDLWSLPQLPRSLAIVGGAATGCQLASIFAAFGSQVTVLEAGPRILGMTDPLIATQLEAAFVRRGIDVISGISGVERIEKGGDGLTLHYRLADQSHTVVVEAVLLAVGWEGNLAALNLEAAGVHYERGYIQVDNTLRTSAPHIYAAGDITGRMPLVQSGSHDGRVAAENAVLRGERAHTHTIVPFGGFTDPEYGAVGITEAQARAAGDCAVAVVPYSDLDRAVVDGKTHGACKLIVSRPDGRILGAHVVGVHALEIVQLVAAGMATGMHVAQLAELEIAYPTFTAIIGLAARQLVRELGIVDLAPSWRALGQLRATEWERSDTIRPRRG
ncbi:NAD(P)/FAD-dependent oxidoreductase [Oscillochloris sp. ZM17-4]|uniref:dihydrolipoyl dehydrogenase family protein n=1 Tax=Oscillochloris sp. ZM17-4 TaxID=2866714 RepID=UPI001C72FBCC|nr:NAD(P)/FAD-dependent oxidoreductase [Oscillochloris sp. ZM17-4]MBX0326533.1 NAD(P)/FAD-dependent oxidoreductase [Oscillochloris sp. ZM17-4]